MVLSRAAAQQVADTQPESPAALMEADRCVAIELIQDDPFNARVVVAELDAHEEAEWVGHVTRVLHVDDGELLVTGGLDPDILCEFIEGEESEYVGRVQVPPGIYRVDVYTYLSSVNGQECVATATAQEQDDAPSVQLGEWFRATRPDVAFPEWLGARLEEDPEQDPGYEELWEDIEESIAEGALTVARESRPSIDFLIQLRPLAGPVGAVAEPQERGWLSPVGGARKPGEFPLGVPSELSPPDFCSPMSHLFDDDEDGPPSGEVDGVPIFERAAGVEAQTVEGGPVEHPAAGLWQVYRLAFWCDGGVHGEVQIDFPEDVDASVWTELPNAACALDERRLRISFADSMDRWELMASLKGLRDALGAIPDGSRVEVVFHNEDGDCTAGNHRYFGDVLGGQWRITDAGPAVDRANLSDALALSAACDTGGPIAAASSEEADAVFDAARVAFEDVGMADDLRREGLNLSVGDCHYADQTILAQCFFRARHAGSWNVAEAMAAEEAGREAWKDMEAAALAKYDF